MPLPKQVRLEALIACQRHCCLCHQRKHTRIQCHHIVPEADGGPDTFENCIPLCLDCHGEVESFNPKHPVGTPYYKEELIRRRNDWYAKVAGHSKKLAEQVHRGELKYPHSAALRGSVSFNYSNHDGYYRLGEGNCEFLTRWSKASDTRIHCYSDNTNLALALATKGSDLHSIRDASTLDFSSLVRTPEIGRFIVFQNHASRFATARIAAIQDDTRGALDDRLAFDYWILEDGSDDFSTI